MKAIALALLASASVVPIDTFAAGAVDAKVVRVRVDKDGRGMVMFDRALWGTPAPCSTTPYSNALAFDSNTAGGRQVMAVALSAQLSGQSIEAFGTGVCTIFGGGYVEDWSTGIVHS